MWWFFFFKPKEEYQISACLVGSEIGIRDRGQSIVDYINNRRIEAAQKLLETTELSISAVAEQTGFASAAHFRRVFREVMGTGPLQYRKGPKK